MNTEVMFSTGRDCWETPNDLFQRYDKIYHFVLDAAADNRNHKCPVWFGPGGICEDALSVDWDDWLRKGNIWLNPPYSRGLQARFVKKAAEAVDIHQTTYAIGHVVLLLPARTDTKLFHEIILPHCGPPDYVPEFLKGRVKFISNEPLRKGSSPNSAPFPSMIVVF